MKAVARRRSAWLAAMLVCSLGAGALGDLHAGGGDRACEYVAVAHDTAQHRFSSADEAPSHAEQHCYLCHSIRQASPLIALARMAPQVGASARLSAPSRTPHSRLRDRRLPSRAPPA
jgi:hypothetical protein